MHLTRTHVLNIMKYSTRRHIIRGKEVSTAYTLSDSGIQTIVRTIMPDLYLIQTYMDDYVCECPEDYDDEIPVGDGDSSTAAASPGLNN